MKKLIYLLTLVLLISSCNKKAKEKRTTINHKINLKISKNNKVFPRIYTIDNYIDLDSDSIIENGNYIGIFKDSTIAFIGAFKNSKPEGLFHFYYFSGKLRETRLYENGLENGPFTFWNEMGFMTDCGNEKNGKLDGFYYTWWDNHNLRSKTFYRNGNPEGIEFYYFENGKIKSISSRKNGFADGEFKEFYETGQVQQTGQYIRAYEIGTWKEYYLNGRLKTVKQFSKSLGEKELKKIHPYKKTMGEYNVSLPISTWLEYDSIGNIKTKTYHDKFFNITRKDEFYSSGKLFKRTRYNGEAPYMCSRHPGYKIKSGKFEEFYSDGKIKTIGFYTDNTKQGVWKYFENTGKIIKTEKFKNDTLLTK